MLLLHASSETGGVDDVERDGVTGVDDQSSVDVARVVVVQQRRTWRTAEEKRCHPIHNRPRLRMPLLR